MKPKKIFFTITALSLLISFNACKKDGSTTNSVSDIAETTTLSQDIAISDNISEDANNSFAIAAEGNNVAGARPAGAETNPNCYTYSIKDSATGNFSGKSKVIYIYFNGNTCIDGIVRSGTIKAVITDSVRKAGSTATLTFINYYVGGYKREGTIVWTNTRVQGSGTASWTRVDSGKVTSPLGHYWYNTGTRSVTETIGTFPADTFTVVSGTHTVTDSAGISATSTVLSPLVKAVTCPNIQEGTLQIQGPHNTLVINFSAGTSDGTLSGTVNYNGTCDDIATYSLNGGTSFPFYLR
jgi:hypothetical protein